MAYRFYAGLFDLSEEFDEVRSLGDVVPQGQRIHVEADLVL